MLRKEDGRQGWAASTILIIIPPIILDEQGLAVAAGGRSNVYRKSTDLCFPRLLCSRVVREIAVE